MLQKLSPKHEEIIRHLICGEKEKDICVICDITTTYLGMLKKEPLFQNRIRELMETINQNFVAQRVTAMDTIDQQARTVTDTCIEAVTEGYITNSNGEAIPVLPSDRLRAARDLLDRANVTRKKEVATANQSVNVAQLVINAYAQRKEESKDGDTNQRISNEEDSSFCVTEVEGDS